MAAAKSGGLRARLRKMVLRDEAEGGARPGAHVQAARFGSGGFG